MAIVIQNPNNKISKRSETDNNKQFVGIKLPLEKDTSTGYFESSSLTIEAAKENLKNFVKTRTGERVFHPDLGLGLEEFLFENFDDNTKTMINDTIDTGIRNWMPFLTVASIEIEENNNTINIIIKFFMNNAPGNLESVNITI